MGKSYWTKIKEECCDPSTNVRYPSHEDHKGYCPRCGTALYPIRKFRLLDADGYGIGEARGINSGDALARARRPDAVRAIR